MVRLPEKVLQFLCVMIHSSPEFRSIGNAYRTDFRRFFNKFQRFRKRYGDSGTDLFHSSRQAVHFREVLRPSVHPAPILRPVCGFAGTLFSKIGKCSSRSPFPVRQIPLLADPIPVVCDNRLFCRHIIPEECCLVLTFWIRNGGGKDFYTPDRADGTLRHRIKEFQIIHFISEEIDPERIFRVRRKNVDDTSAYAELTSHFCHISTLIPGKCQHLPDIFIIYRISYRHIDRYFTEANSIRASP